MSPATATAPMTSAPVGPEFFRVDMPLEQLQPSPMNPRKVFDEARLQELAQSFAGVGIIEPLVARPAAGYYEVICGGRRLRAAALAGLTTLPVIVKSLTDAQALEIMVIENNQREDVAPLEEAEGFQRLLKTGYALDKLAERLGRSKKYIYDRIKLLDLVPTAKLLVGDGRLSAGHAILLARLKAPDQERALDPDDGGVFEEDTGADDPLDDESAGTLVRTLGKKADPVADYLEKKPVSVRELDRWIAEHVRFDVAHAAAAAPLEYGAVADRVKQAAAKPGRGKKVIAITFEHYIQPEARDGADRTFGPRSFKFADGQKHYESYTGRSAIAPACEHAVLGVVAAGEKYGQAFDVCIARDKCQVHWKSEIAARTKNQKLRDTGRAEKADKNEAAARARAATQQKEREAARRRRELAEDRGVNQAVDAITELTPDLLRMVLKALLHGDVNEEGFRARFKIKVGWNTSAKDLKSLSGRVLVQAVAFALLSGELIVGDGKAALAMFNVDLAKIDAAIAREESAAGAPKPVQTSAPKSAKKKR